MHYVYVLHSKSDGKLYIGCTNDLKRRICEHNDRKVYATRNRVPLSPVYYECFINKSDAFTREKWLKTGWGRNHLHKILANTLKNLGG